MADIAWKKVSERSEIIGYRLVLHKTFRLPDGKESEFTTFKLKIDDVACVVALTKDRHIIVARQYRPGPEKIMDELPGGFIDPGQTPEQTAARELLEETGYKGKLEYLATLPRDAYLNGRWHYFIASDCEKIQEPDQGEHEFIEIATLSLDEFLKSIYDGRVGDSGGALLALRKLGL
jgi:ADP-ribose pyrophosphatase